LRIAGATKSLGESYKWFQRRKARKAIIRSLTTSSSTPLLRRDEYAVSQDGMKMFGVLDLETAFEECRFSIGMRNSNDKSMPRDDRGLHHRTVCSTILCGTLESIEPKANTAIHSNGFRAGPIR
jgi:hypothetical protein